MNQKLLLWPSYNRVNNQTIQEISTEHNIIGVLTKSADNPSSLSWRTAFWVGFVFSSPVAFGCMQHQMKQTAHTPSACVFSVTNDSKQYNAVITRLMQPRQQDNIPGEQGWQEYSKSFQVQYDIEIGWKLQWMVDLQYLQSFLQAGTQYTIYNTCFITMSTSSLYNIFHYSRKVRIWSANNVSYLHNADIWLSFKAINRYFGNSLNPLLNSIGYMWNNYKTHFMHITCVQTITADTCFKYNFKNTEKIQLNHSLPT